METTPPTAQKCVYTIVLDNWFPELCAVTLPLYKQWAHRIGADFQIITECKFPGWPANYERFQVYELGKRYFWNIVLDADYIINPHTLEDPTLDPTNHTGQRNPLLFYAEGKMQANYYFRPHKYFIRDGRNEGIGDSFVMTSYYTHDVWTPLDMPYEEAREYCIRDPRQVSEFCFSLNVARFGLDYDGVIGEKANLYHLGSTSKNRSREDTMAIAQLKLREMGL